jgi:hypothetical protein
MIALKARCGDAHLESQILGKKRKEDCGWRPAQSERPYLKNKLKAKGLGHCTNDIELTKAEFNPQYDQNKQTKKLFY